MKFRQKGNWRKSDLWHKENERDMEEDEEEKPGLRGIIKLNIVNGLHFHASLALQYGEWSTEGEKRESNRNRERRETESDGYREKNGQRERERTREIMQKSCVH